MATPKEDLVRLLQQQPDDSSHEELVRELALSVMVERGLADSDARRVVPDDEMAHRIRQWRKIAWTAEAQIWLRDIYDYIAADNPAAAERVALSLNVAWHPVPCATCEFAFGDQRT